MLDQTKQAIQNQGKRTESLRSVKVGDKTKLDCTKANRPKSGGPWWRQMCVFSNRKHKDKLKDSKYIELKINDDQN